MAVETRVTDTFRKQIDNAANRLEVFGSKPESVGKSWTDLADVDPKRLLFQASRVRALREQTIHALEKPIDLRDAIAKRGDY